MIRAALLAVITFTMLGQAIFGQSFEVASIKLHDGPPTPVGVTTSGNRLTTDCSNVGTLLMYAYNLKAPMASTSPLVKDGVPCWDIAAKAEGDAVPTNAQFRQMLKTLLEERFQLKVHREMREGPVYALVVARTGIKFKESDPDADSTGIDSFKGRNIVIVRPKATMRDVVDAVTKVLLERPVVDKTGLTGTYNIKLTCTPGYITNRESGPGLSDISVFQALEEQLGLKLEARKEPVEILVIDHVEKPSGN
jgi:uncharacterized protein (TIGR03435 family)